MKVVVVYESMFGNTHLVADAIAAGLAHEAGADVGVAVTPVGAVDDELLAGARMVVVGGPTHVHGMARASTRRAAADTARKPGSDRTLDGDAEGPGLREWFDAVGFLPPNAAAFDTRLKGPTLFTGRASKGIAKRLSELGCDLVVEPRSFLVGKDDHLLADELEAARSWGAQLARALVMTR